MSLPELVKISRRYGSDERFLLAGGGNTSFKDNEYLFIKASGFALSTIEENGFVKMLRKSLDSIWTKEYPEDPNSREATALADLMNSKAPGEEQKRPSVETLLHNAIPHAYVVHTHPALVNGLTSSQGGKNLAEELFGNKMLWIPVVNPGYVLAVTIKNAMDAYQKEHNALPAFILLQNHGVFVSGDTTETIDQTYREIFSVLAERVVRNPDFSPVAVSKEPVNELLGTLNRIFENAGEGAGRPAEFAVNVEIRNFVQDRQSFHPVSSAFTPDQIVYCGREALFIDEAEPSESFIERLVAEYVGRCGVLPNVIAVKGLGFFGFGANEKAAANAVLLFLDAVKIAVYSESFGGALFLPKDQIDFIVGWEVEHYRSKIGAQEEGSAE